MKQQRGISLIVVLIGLVIISFAAVALLRSTDTATLIAGNLGFKKTALASGDAGSEAAITWLTANNSNTLFADQTASGYYSTSRDGCDMTGSRTPNNPDDDVDWAGDSPKPSCNVSATLPDPQPTGVSNGYSVSFVVNRMCNAAGDPAAVLAADGLTPMICSTSDANADGTGSTKGSIDYQSGIFGISNLTYYRITTRIAGPRNTVRYVQAWVVL